MSKNRRGGLGRGIGALIPTSAEEAGGSPTDIFFGGRSGIGLRARPISVAPERSDAADDAEVASPLQGDLRTDGGSAIENDTGSTEIDGPLGDVSTGGAVADDSHPPAAASSDVPATGPQTEAAPPDGPDADASAAAGPGGVTGAANSVATSRQVGHAPSDTDDALAATPERDLSDGGAPAGENASSHGTLSSTDKDEDLAPVPGARLQFLPVTAIRANARQPRTAFDEDALEELAHSIREFGVLQPVVVRPDGNGFELVMGERRLRAAALAGLTSIPAVVRDTEDDAMLRDALLENIHRAQLNPLEEAAAYQQLLQEFGVTHDQLAGRLGRSRSQVSNTIRLLNLPVPVQRRVAAGVLSAGHARALLALENADAQDDVAGRIVAEGLSVRATEEMVSLAAAGHGDHSSRRRPTRRFIAPAAADLAERLSDTFDTRVRVDIGRRKGRITVEFASIDDLERIVGLMAPDLATQSAESAFDNGSLAGPGGEPGHAASVIEAGWRAGVTGPGHTPAGAAVTGVDDGNGTAAVRLAAVPTWEPGDPSVQ